MSKISLVPSRIIRSIILKLEYLNSNLYKELYMAWLKRQGVVFTGKPNYISNQAYIDGSRFDMITIGKGSTISRDVLILTHDYSMHTVYQGLKEQINEECSKRLQLRDAEDSMLDQRPVVIGNHSFIGARACLLPGTYIGDNCIVGAGSVVKGKIPDNSIVIGNPAVIVNNTKQWLEDK